MDDAYKSISNFPRHVTTCILSYIVSHSTHTCYHVVSHRHTCYCSFITDRATLPRCSELALPCSVSRDLQVSAVHAASVFSAATWYFTVQESCNLISF